MKIYYLSGAHIYEISHGRGIPKTRIAFKETPRGDGKFLWAESRLYPNLTADTARRLIEDRAAT